MHGDNSGLVRASVAWTAQIQKSWLSGFPWGPQSPLFSPYLPALPCPQIPARCPRFLDAPRIQALWCVPPNSRENSCITRLPDRGSLCHIKYYLLTVSTQCDGANHLQGSSRGGSLLPHPQTGPLTFLPKEHSGLLGRSSALWVMCPLLFSNQLDSLSFIVRNAPRPHWYGESSSNQPFLIRNTG